MSRYGEEDRDALDADVQMNASCTDCGVDYAKAENDLSTWCDACSDRRDAWATALEIRFMAKAVLKADVTTVKDVA
jgi:hypothetical protein